MKYFTLNELTRSATAEARGIDNTPPPTAVTALETLVTKVLDPLREAWGAPIRITSGYRSVALNKAVGGAAHSQHTLGEAADINLGSAQQNAQLWALLRSLALPVDQAINEHDFKWIHISCGPRNRRSYFAIR